MTEPGIEIPEAYLEAIELTSDRISSGLEVQKLEKDLEDEKSKFHDWLKEQKSKGKRRIAKSIGLITRVSTHRK